MSEECKILDFIAYRARLARAKLDLEEPRKAVARNMDAWEQFRALQWQAGPSGSCTIDRPFTTCQHGVDLNQRGCRACEHGSEL